MNCSGGGGDYWEEEYQQGAIQQLASDSPPHAFPSAARTSINGNALGTDAIQYVPVSQCPSLLYNHYSSIDQGYTIKQQRAGIGFFYRHVWPYRHCISVALLKTLQCADRTYLVTHNKHARHFNRYQ